MGWGGEKRRREISQSGGEKNSFPFLFFWGSYACGILVLWSWIKTVPPAMEAQSLNYWPSLFFFLSFCLLFSSFFPRFSFDCEKQEAPKGGLESLQSWDPRGSAKCCYMLHIKITFVSSERWKWKGEFLLIPFVVSGCTSPTLLWEWLIRVCDFPPLSRLCSFMGCAF